MTTAAAPARRWPVSSAVLVLANVAPLIGVLAHYWTVFAVVLLYWCENVVVGVFNVLRMLCARPQDGLAWAGKAFLIPFFCVHYGMFTFVHGIFVLGLFGGGFAKAGMSLSPLALKTAIDLGAHLAERRKLGPTSDQALFATTSS